MNPTFYCKSKLKDRRQGNLMHIKVNRLPFRQFEVFDTIDGRDSQTYMHHYKPKAEPVSRQKTLILEIPDVDNWFANLENVFQK